MAVMINTLGRRSQAQSDASAQAQQTDGETKEKGKVGTLLENKESTDSELETRMEKVERTKVRRVSTQMCCILAEDAGAGC